MCICDPICQGNVDIIKCCKQTCVNYYHCCYTHAPKYSYKDIISSKGNNVAPTLSSKLKNIINAIMLLLLEHTCRLPSWSLLCPWLQIALQVCHSCKTERRVQLWCQRNLQAPYAHHTCNTCIAPETGCSQMLVATTHCLTWSGTAISGVTTGYRLLLQRSATSIKPDQVHLLPMYTLTYTAVDSCN